jgi:hypothetical protein
MQLILHLKPWKLFIIIMAPNLLSSIEGLSAIIMPIASFAYLSWIHSVGLTMNEKIPASSRPSSSYFTVSCLCCWLYHPYGIFLEHQIIRSETVSILLFLYIIWSFFYSIMFSSRMLESVIEGKLVSRSEAIKAFVCFIMFPWGVWHIQPAVQRVLKNKLPEEHSPMEY